jgi:ribose transport system substrate-binding protein
MSSIKDVAKLAKVSVATVSRVINQSAPVEAITQKKVEKAIAKLNYRPNLMAIGLRQQKTVNSQKVLGSNYSVFENYSDYARENKQFPGLPGQGKKLAFAGIGTHRFCMAVQQNIIKQARLAGFDEQGLILTNNQYNREIALQNAEFILSLKPDIFIQYQGDALVNNIIAEKFQAANIPIIAVDVPVPGSPFVGVNNWRVATLGGKFMARMINKKWGGYDAIDRIVLLQFTQGGEGTLLRSEGFATALVDVFGEQIESKIIRIDGGRGYHPEAKVAMQDILREYPNDKHMAITAINEQSLRGVLEALKATDRFSPDEKIIVGTGGDNLGKQQIREGLIDGTVGFFPEKYGELIVPAACAMMEGHPVQSHIYIKNSVITPKNIERYSV